MSSVTPDFFYVFNLILSFSTCSQSFNKICVWDVLGANVLKAAEKYYFKICEYMLKILLCQKTLSSYASKPSHSTKMSTVYIC